MVLGVRQAPILLITPNVFHVPGLWRAQTCQRPFTVVWNVQTNQLTAVYVQLCVTTDMHFEEMSRKRACLQSLGTTPQ